MKLTRRQQTFAIIAALSIGALVLDQTVLGPRDVSAGSSSAEGSVSPPIVSDTVDPQRSARPDPRHVLAARLAQIHTERGLDPLRVPDAFQAPPSWLPKAATTTVVDQVAPGSAADAFLKGHRLNAVMANRSGGIAIIDGKRFRVGQTIEVFTLVEVRERSVILEGDGTRIELSLP